VGVKEAAAGKLRRYLPGALMDIRRYFGDFFRLR
jgi:hypothetical protein